MKKYIAAALLSVCFLAGCSDWERTTFQTLSASKAVEDSAQTSYEARTIPHNQCVYGVINKAKAAQTVAVDAMMTYETVKSSTSATVAQNAVNSALANLAPIIASMQTLGTSTCATTAVLSDEGIAPIQSSENIWMIHGENRSMEAIFHIPKSDHLKTFDNAQYGTRRVAK